MKNASQIETHFKSYGVLGAWPLTSGILLSKFHAGADSDAEGTAVYRVGVLLLCLWGGSFLWGG